LEKIVIVESPAKARTIERYLGKDYHVLSSMGHIRDLPHDELGVDVEEDFEPHLIVTNQKQAASLRKAVKGATMVYLATDNDREGEAIAYDLFEVLDHKNRAKYARVVFNEITREVIRRAIGQPGEIDLQKVEAQRARRILDRLVGYQVSPLLSVTLAGNKYEGLSAGRVQSVALRLICDREREIDQFVPQEYWTVDVQLGNGKSFQARLVKIKGEKPAIGSKDEAERVRAELEKLANSPGFLIAEVSDQEVKQSPPPPFITSTLQQAASSRLSFAPPRTMKIAQQLYEGVALAEGHEGLITYMRTDSLRVSPEAQKSVRAFIQTEYGEPYLSEKVRNYQNKKAAQDAHEAIRPTAPERTPQQVKEFLSAEQFKLYQLIWQRFTATQMAEACYLKRKAQVRAGDYLFEATGSRLLFDGFSRVWPMKARSDEGIEIPDLTTNQRLQLLKVLTEQHFTEPPKRFSEASLIKTLEQDGIGRPSTYATIVSTIQERGYVEKVEGALRPTLLGFITADFLKTFFPQTVQIDFTAQMEEELDKVSEGERTRLQVLKEFYGPFSQRLETATRNLKSEDRPFKVLSDVACPVCGAPMEVRFWKGSRFLGCSRYPTCKGTVDLPASVPFLYREKQVLVQEALQTHQSEKKKETRQLSEVRCPQCDAPMVLKDGKFGRFYGCSTYPKCKSTQPIAIDVPCPRCGRPMVERYSRKRHKSFYSCSGYPECKFLVDSKPVKLCPDCEEGLLIAGKEPDTLVCSNKKCSHQEAAPGEAVAATAPASGS
jgi:DNA topoisomerase-1